MAIAYSQDSDGRQLLHERRRLVLTDRSLPRAVGSELVPRRPAERTDRPRLGTTRARPTRCVRLTVDLTRPIPFAGFRVEGVVVRPGRTVSHDRADDRRRRRASRWSRHARLHVARASVGRPADDAVEPARARPSRAPACSRSARAATRCRTSPATASRSATRPATASEADRRRRGCAPSRCSPTRTRRRSSASARSPTAATRSHATANPGSYTFMNPDLTIVLHREPIGEWFGTRSVSRWEPIGDRDQRLVAVRRARRRRAGGSDARDHARRLAPADVRRRVPGCRAARRPAREEIGSARTRTRRRSAIRRRPTRGRRRRARWQVVGDRDVG